MTDPIIPPQSRRSAPSWRLRVAAVLLLLGLGMAGAHAEAPSLGRGVRNWIGTFQRDWLGSIWHLSLFDAKSAARPTRPDSQDGFRFSRPFGERGPDLRLSPSMPTDTSKCLNAATGIDGAPINEDRVEAFVILQHRW